MGRNTVKPETLRTGRLYQVLGGVIDVWVPVYFDRKEQKQKWHGKRLGMNNIVLFLRHPEALPWQYEATNWGNGHKLYEFLAHDKLVYLSTRQITRYLSPCR